MNHKPRWDIFCAVVDNYGDIGVCWRLARQLANEHAIAVRLWVDDLVPLTHLHPGVDPALEAQRVDGVEVREWPQCFPAVEVADAIIEAFACELPASYVEAMSQRASPPLWINLEYLSAEDWVEGAHGLPSPHPWLPLTKYFFFPGFTAKTGGLICEGDYAERASRFDAAAFRMGLGLPPARTGELTISLFGYENAALPGLLDAWSRSDRPVCCLVPEGRMLPAVRDYFGHRDEPLQRGHLTANVLPFLPQRDYDALLWLCGLNFVRGEDSFVRAQWAAKPLIWQVYAQAESTHLRKLDAFLDRYLEGVPQAAADASRAFWNAWNEGGDAGAAWPGFAAALPMLTDHAARWATWLTAFGDLASNLVRFSAEKRNK